MFVVYCQVTLTESPIVALDAAVVLSLELVAAQGQSYRFYIKHDSTIIWLTAERTDLTYTVYPCSGAAAAGVSGKSWDYGIHVLGQ
jgi:hypothetical protein